MRWYEKAVFYHIYPLGLLGAPKKNSFDEPVSRLKELDPWIGHMQEMGVDALYIGPLSESEGHGYETVDYRRLDSRLGTNEDLVRFVRKAHEAGIRVIFDGVFNHTGRGFFAFQDILKNRENSPYVSWYCNVNFYGNNEFNDGFSYESWGGYNILPRLNQKNPEVQQYLCDVIRFWVKTFDIDGLRLDAADVLDFGFMECLRRLADEVKEDFFLLGEVIHGEYNRWVNDRMLHSVTNYAMNKAFWSAHNDHNYFEIAHTLKRQSDMGIGRLYLFVDNHDVERIISRLNRKADFVPVHILLYTLPGIPSVYYGSEYGIEGKKERWSDDSLRPALKLSDFRDDNPYYPWIKALGRLRRTVPALSEGTYKELALTTGQYVFARCTETQTAIIAVNNQDSAAAVHVKGLGTGTWKGVFSGEAVTAKDGEADLTIAPHGGEIYLSEDVVIAAPAPIAVKPEEKKEVTVEAKEFDIPYEEMTVEQLQAGILAKMAKNGPVTDQMKRDVAANVYRDSLLNWIRSFR